MAERPPRVFTWQYEADWHRYEITVTVGGQYRERPIDWCGEQLTGLDKGVYDIGGQTFEEFLARGPPRFTPTPPEVVAALREHLFALGATAPPESPADERATSEQQQAPPARPPTPRPEPLPPGTVHLPFFGTFDAQTDLTALLRRDLAGELAWGNSYDPAPFGGFLIRLVQADPSFRDRAAGAVVACLDDERARIRSLALDLMVRIGHESYPRALERALTLHPDRFVGVSSESGGRTLLHAWWATLGCCAHAGGEREALVSAYAAGERTAAAVADSAWPLVLGLDVERDVTLERLPEALTRLDPASEGPLLYLTRAEHDAVRAKLAGAVAKQAFRRLVKVKR